MKREFTVDNIPENIKMFYSNTYNYNNGYFEDIEEFKKYCKENGVEPPIYIYGTIERKLKIDARLIAENELEDWYDDAMENVDEDALAELQKALDKFCETCGVGPAYVLDVNTRIKLRRE